MSESPTSKGEDIGRSHIKEPDKDLIADLEQNYFSFKRRNERVEFMKGYWSVMLPFLSGKS